MSWSPSPVPIAERDDYTRVVTLSCANGRTMDLALHCLHDSHRDVDPKVVFSNFGEYQDTIHAAVYQTNHRGAIVTALRRIRDSGEEAMDLLKGTGQYTPETMDLFKDLTDAEFNKFVEVYTKVDRRDAAFLQAMRKVPRGFTSVFGGPENGFVAVMLDAIVVLASFGHRILLVMQGEVKCQDVAELLRSKITASAMPARGRVLVHTKYQERLHVDEVNSHRIIVGTPHAVNRAEVWTAFQPYVIFGSWGSPIGPTELDLLGIVAHYMVNPDSETITPFIQFGYGNIRINEEIHGSSPHPQLSLSLMTRMYLLSNNEHQVSQERDNGRSWKADARLQAVTRPIKERLLASNQEAGKAKG